MSELRSRFRGQELKDDNLFGFVLSTRFLVSSFCMFVLYFLFSFQYLKDMF